jgi:ribosomal protein S18 acetylase RimI-like enzyme
VQVGPVDLVERAAEAVRIQQVALAQATGTSVADDRAEVFGRHAQRPGFRAVGATAQDGELVGFGYGYLELPGSWWYQRVEPALAVAGQTGWLERAFTVAELHVRPDRQGHGIGTALLEALLALVGQDRVLLSTQRDDNPSRGFYRSRGFTEVASVDFPGLRTYVVLGRELPLPARVQTAGRAFEMPARGPEPLA